MNLVAWIITDGKAGHEKQSLGLLQALGVGLYLVLQTIVDSFRDPEIYDSLFDVT